MNLADIDSADRNLTDMSLRDTNLTNGNQTGIDLTDKSKSEPTTDHCNIVEREVVIIGAGLTGLTAAATLVKRGKNIQVLEKQNRIGGQIQTHQEEGFTFESGPNTGVLSYPEVAELFQELDGLCELEVAREESKKRLIWKNNRFHALPSGLISGLFTPLFDWKDKIGMIAEPFRKKGTNPNESVGELTVRRLGRSFLNYAVDPFISGIYAGDPMKLVTRHALPKLYNLEQDYGSFIRGAVAKARQPKTERDRLATKKVFSMYGGLQQLIDALGERIGRDRLTLQADNLRVSPYNDRWEVSFTGPEEKNHTIRCQKVITTTGSYALPALLPFVKEESMRLINNLTYAPVVQVSVGYKLYIGSCPQAFGGLVPSCEKQSILGVLFPSSCFSDRVPGNGTLLSFFIGGARHPEFMEKSDEEIRSIIRSSINELLRFPKEMEPDLIKIFRHEKAIPQYEVNCEERFLAIDALETAYPGLIIGGNLKGGIGMADRIRQAIGMAARI